MTNLPVPKITLTVSPSMINLGQQTVLTWACSGSPSNKGKVILTADDNRIAEWVSNGDALQQWLTDKPLVSTCYTVTFTDVNGTVATATACVTVIAPYSAPLTATPSTVASGASTTLTWTITGGLAPFTASIDQGIGSVATPSGNTSVAVTNATRFTLTVTDTRGVVTTATADVSVNVTQTINKFSFATATGTWNAPGDFISYNSVDCIGEGGAQTDSGHFGGGGGGAWSTKASSLPSTPVNVQIGTGATSTDTWFGSAATVMAKAGGVTATNTGATGGQASGCVGDSAFSGGSGGNGGGNGGGGGGGAAGFHGVGANGANGNPPTNGGTGGNGDAGFGGAGSVSGINPGGNGQEYDSTHGSGGGSGGIGPIVSGAAGGNYGGGSGGNNHGGSPGLVIVNYVASNGVIPYSPITGTLSASPTTTFAGDGVTLTWSSANATAASFDQGVGSVSTSGSTVVNPTVTTTYTLTLTAPNCTTLTIPVTITVTPIAAPSSLTATAGCASVLLSWPTVAGATSYAVYRQLHPSGGYGLLGSPSTNTFTDSTPIFPNSYDYYVLAARGSVQSGQSPTATTAPTAIPSVPTGIAVTGKTPTFTITAGAVSNATSYNLYRSDVSGGQGTTPVQSGAPTPAFVDYPPSLAQETFFYTCTAVNACGESAQSSEGFVIPHPPSGWG